MEIDFLTSNELKVSIAKEIFEKSGFKIKHVKAEVIEPQEIDLKESIKQKLIQASKVVLENKNRFLMVSDDGFYIESLNNFPGALLKPVMGGLTPVQILKLAQTEAAAKYINALGIYDFEKQDSHIFICETPGKLSVMPKGEHLRKLLIETIFIPNGHTKTLAEMSEQEWTSFFDTLKSRLPYWQAAACVQSKLSGVF